MTIPSRAKLISNIAPLIWCSWQFHNFSILLNECLTNIYDNQGNGVVGYSKGESQAEVAFSGGKVSEGDGQLETLPSGVSDDPPCQGLL